LRSNPVLRHRGLDDDEPIQTRHLREVPVDLEDLAAALWASEEELEDVGDLAVLVDGRAHRPPRLLEGEAREHLRLLRAGEAVAGLGRVEGYVARFLGGDPLQQNGERWALLDLGESVVGGDGRPLVRGAPD